MYKIIETTGCSAERSEAVKMFRKVSEILIIWENGDCLKVHASPRGKLILSRPSHKTMQISYHDTHSNHLRKQYNFPIMLVEMHRSGPRP